VATAAQLGGSRLPSPPDLQLEGTANWLVGAHQQFSLASGSRAGRRTFRDGDRVSSSARVPWLPCAWRCLCRRARLRWIRCRCSPALSTASNWSAGAGRPPGVGACCDPECCLSGPRTCSRCAGRPVLAGRNCLLLPLMKSLRAPDGSGDQMLRSPGDRALSADQLPLVWHQAAGGPCSRICQRLAGGHRATGCRGLVDPGSHRRTFQGPPRIRSAQAGSGGRR